MRHTEASLLHRLLNQCSDTDPELPSTSSPRRLRFSVFLFEIDASFFLSNGKDEQLT
jgi:hypothetical protein